MKDRVVHIKGMTCHHCVMAVRKELIKIPDLNVKDVQIGSASLTYDEAKVTETQIQAAIEEAGYAVVP